MKKSILGILFSGSGSTAEVMVKAIRAGKFANLTIGCAITNNPEAKGIAKLQNLDVPVYIVQPTTFRTIENKLDRKAFGTAILDTLTKHHVTVITQNGWIPLTPRNVIEQFEGQIFNQHPGPVPEFGGKGMMGIIVHDAVLRFQKKIRRRFPSEVVAHRVTTQLDEGAVVRKIAVPILPGDTPEMLQKRALPLEHKNQLLLLEDIDIGNVKEIPPREKSLITPSEKEYLAAAKQEAVKQYS